MARKKQVNEADPIAAEAIREAKTMLEDEEVIERNRLELTRSEIEEMRLLCSYLGLSRDACLSVATKYCCSTMCRSTTVLAVPKLKKATKSNPKEEIDYRISAEASSDFRTAQPDFSPDWPTNESEFVRMALAVLAKKLLPPKKKREGNE